MSSAEKNKRPLALITGAGRSIGIGAAIARTLAADGWDLALSYWTPYDKSMPWGIRSGETEALRDELVSSGANASLYPADLSDPAQPEQLFETIEAEQGAVQAMILSHCYSVDSDIFSTTVESFDRHFAVNARASWLLVREFGMRYKDQSGKGRIIGLTSDHTAGNLPYGASKGALDRIVLASAVEFRDKGITANVINPGATDTGWMDEDLKKTIGSITLSNRLGTPRDCANLVRFLCSENGQWVNGQLLYSNGGIA
ncbi:SDR family oxidoreductase [Spirochaeta isovalerica]|uniref:3-oxoacyl-[acyl-carrier protein] reductase n=1 Tax=Spirochaeta isovalerica TaxID=150 RepID=A0A841R825_9SPIO|nr:SDR family oxidoreductase [Spirochaeta isovalerica]MBB6479521.1 3-oxoacyl-[acyl-carrier protein] reductase [Spirochaeta isovalerica]